MSCRTTLLASFAVALAAGRGTAAPPAFEADVLPILKRRCFECHDDRKQTASYRIDVRAVAVRGGESGEPAIRPGKSGDSELIRRVVSHDELDRMPPEGDRLPATEIETLKAWIDAGAVWPDALAGDDPRRSEHWAFRRPVRPPVPDVKNPAWSRNAIDRFVAARHDREGWMPSADADRVTLVRRASLDLIGLPPTPEEVDAFLADAAPGAYERRVDRLLASPHFGEKWGRHWLDAARYADSDGYEKDKPRFVWHYRDYVIDALNRDLPYDRFVVEQLAGDLLPDATQDQVVATGFLRNSMINEEGGVDPEQFRMEAMFDRMDALGKAFLGLTVACAQCHDHKFDPLTQEEYYRLFAFVNNSDEAAVSAYDRDEGRIRDRVLAGIADVEADLKRTAPDWRERMAAWESTVRGDRPEWTVVRPELDASGGQKHHLLADGSVLADGYAPTKHTTSFTAKTDAKEIKAVRLELLNDANLPRNGPGRSVYGLMALSEFKLDVGGKEVKLSSVTANANPPERPLEAVFDDRSDKPRVTGPVAYALDGKNETAWSIDVGPGRSNVPREAVFVLAEPLRLEPGTELTFRLAQNHGGWNSDDNQNNNLGRFRFSVTSAPAPQADPLPADVRRIIETVPVADRSPAQTAAVFSYWRTTVPEFADANAAIERLWSEHPMGDTQLVLHERDETRPTSLLKRGDFLSPARPVEPGVPAFLNDWPPDAPRNRLGMAEWLVAADAPTTARAIVNRLWQHHFGTGLVETSEDLGTQAAVASHPELLDWLAVELVESGWSLKHVHRLIATSATYRQESGVRRQETGDFASLTPDPYNRLLARGPRGRVAGEIVRDVALAASGLLNPEVGGPSVYPPIPEFLLKPPVSYGPKAWPTSPGSERYRRAVYTFRFRSLPYPTLETFDAPVGNTACVRRSGSNTPLQALVGLNEPIFLDCARALALKTVTEAPSDAASRLDFAFRRCLARTPTDAERAELLRLIDAQRLRFASGELDPWTLAAADPKNPPALPPGVAPADLAAWTAVARVLLNLDETITRE